MIPAHPGRVVQADLLEGGHHVVQVLGELHRLLVHVLSGAGQRAQRVQVRLEGPRVLCNICLKQSTLELTLMSGLQCSAGLRDGLDG